MLRSTAKGTVVLEAVTKPHTVSMNEAPAASLVSSASAATVTVSEPSVDIVFAPDALSSPPAAAAASARSAFHALGQLHDCSNDDSGLELAALTLAGNWSSVQERVATDLTMVTQLNPSRCGASSPSRCGASSPAARL